MNLTPTEKLHYDAICNYNLSDFIAEDNPAMNHLISQRKEAAQACAKITEQEKLKFAIEILKGIEPEDDWTMKNLMYDIQLRIEHFEHQLKQQLNELEV